MHTSCSHAIADVPSDCVVSIRVRDTVSVDSDALAGRGLAGYVYVLADDNTVGNRDKTADIEHNNLEESVGMHRNTDM